MADHTDSLRAAAATETDTASIIRQIRAATAKFKDRKMAETAGYRQFGPDMPNMGNHWINPSLAVNRVFDLAQPSTLTYLDVGGELKLTGVAYTYPVRPGEQPPDLPDPAMSWHYHSGDLEEEAHGLHHDTMHSGEADEVRLAMIHAWIWSGNPAGTFSADNWALSYLRQNVKPPANPDPAASKALFLADDDGVAYYLRFIELAVHPRPVDTVQVREILLQSAGEVKAWAAAHRDGRQVTMPEQESLVQVWHTLWGDVKTAVGGHIWPHIARHLPDAIATP